MGEYTERDAAKAMAEGIANAEAAEAQAKVREAVEKVNSNEDGMPALSKLIEEMKIADAKEDLKAAVDNDDFGKAFDELQK